MSITIPPSVFGSANLYTSPEWITITTVAGNKAFGSQFTLQPLYGQVRSFFIDTVVFYKENTAVLPNDLTGDSEIEVSFDAGAHWHSVMALADMLYTPASTIAENQFIIYGDLNLITTAAPDLSIENVLRFRITSAEALQNNLVLGLALCLRFSNVDGVSTGA